MGTFFTILIAVIIAYLVFKNVKRTVNDARVGKCTGCPMDCHGSESCPAEKIGLDEIE